jgi:hypothetical protein
MASQITENRFGKGMNKDLDPRVLSNQNVRDAVNVSLIFDSESSAYRNVKGTRLAANIIDSIPATANILASVDVNALYEADNSTRKSVMLFGYSDGKSWIRIFDAENDQVDVLYETDNPDGLNFPPEGTISAKVYREGNIDRVYFTDNQNPIRVIDAVVRDPADYPDYRTLTLQRYFPVDTLQYLYVGTGGELVAGTYQFAYRYVNIEDNRFSTWSLTTNPIPVVPVDTDNTPTDQVYGGFVDEPTNKKIVLRVNVGESSFSPTAWDGMYDAIQLAIIKRIEGNKIPPLQVFLTAPVREWYDTGDIEYRGAVGADNTAESTISIEEFLAKQSPICTAKTLEIKQNILFAGNITYCDVATGIDDIVVSDAQETTKLIGSEDFYDPSLNNPNTNNPVWTFGGDVQVNLIASNTVDNPDTFFKLFQGIVPLGTTNLDPIFVWSEGFELWPRYQDSENYIQFRWNSPSIGQFGQEGIKNLHTPTFPDDPNSVNSIYSKDPIISIQDPKAGNTFIMDVNIQVRLYNNITGEENDNAGEQWAYITGSDNDTFQEIKRFEYIMDTDDPEELYQALEQFLLQVSTTYAIGNREALTVERVSNGVRVQHNGVLDVYDTGTVTWNSVAFKNAFRFGFRTEKGTKAFVVPNTSGENADPVLDTSGGYTNPNNCVNSKGYFRDELYRFGIVFLDQYGNESAPEPFDFSAFGKNTKDWRFSNRNDECLWNFDSSIKALGLNIALQKSSLPSWAVAYTIVRMRRKKNILHQTINVPLIAVQPATELPNNTCTEADEKASVIGTYAPKKAAIGPSQHMIRDNATGATGDVDTPKYEWSDNTSSRERIVPAMFSFPPTYMYNNEGTSYEKYQFVANSSVEVVDACTFFLTPPFDVDGSGIDDGTNKGDQLAFALRADKNDNYYYRTNNIQDIKGKFGFSQFFGSGTTKVLDTAALLSEPYVFPTVPLSTFFNYKLITDFYNLDSVVLENTGDGGNDVKSVPVQKGAIFYLNSPWGDMTYLASDSAIKTDNPFVQPLMFQPTGFNVQDAAYDALGNIPEDNKILNYLDGAVSAAAICNVVRGLGDDRYGDLDDINEYINTGSYHPKDLTPANTQVFGGDCFISKTSFRCTSRHVGVFNIDECGHGFQDKIKAYPDWCEIYMYYVESVINCTYCSDRFRYPRIDNRALPEFESTFFYEYNFAYSAENDIRKFVSTSLVNEENNRTRFPSRIVYSNTKVYQAENTFDSFLEGFDTFSPLSFYDLDETLGAITDMQKILDNDLYVLQENAVCEVPVNRSIIEDSLGGEMVINSSAVISLPRYFNTEYGCQHMRTVTKTGSEIYFVDVARKDVFVLSRGVQKIGSLGLWTYFNEKLDDNLTISEHLLAGYYDFDYDEYHIIKNNEPTVPKHDWGVIWNNKIKAWTSRVELTNNTSFLSMCYQNQALYVFGIDANRNLVAEEMYDGENNVILSSDISSSIDVIVNVNGTIGKIFDLVIVDSRNPVNAVSFEVEHNATDTVTSTYPLPPRRHDNEWVSVPKTQGTNRRIRGKYMTVNIDMTTGASVPVTVKGLLTKYRLDYRVQ